MVIFNAVSFLGVLFGSVYLPLVGQGKYRPWGYINRLAGYYPIEHVKRSEKSPQIIEAGLLKKNDEKNDGGQNNDGPTIEEKLEIYLDKIGKAKYIQIKSE